ncbi:MAG: extracellular solute-binding protein [Lactobacillales bacterium]|jgi:putative aldouronate transport system substrate-binding protein|nr:extracellular solute-binding protein [Lactobacillales bacterium]
MKRNKLALVCGAVLLSLTLAGCGGSTKGADTSKKADVEVSKTDFPIVDKKLKMTMLAPGAGMAEWKDMPTLNEYAKKTNIEFSYTTPPLSDFVTKLNLAFASGEIPDVIFGAGSNFLTRGQEVDYGEQGILLPLEDLIDDYAPNFKKVLEKNPEIKKSITTPDGHIYSLPMVSISDNAVWISGPIWYNGSWLEKLDVKELPKTTDEFYALLKRFRDEDPNGNGKKDEIPLTDVSMKSARPWLMGAFGVLAQGVQERDDKVEYMPISKEYKAYLTYMNKLYSEKLLDPEVYSQADEQKKAKGNDNRVGVFPDWFSFFTTGQNEDQAISNPMWQPISSPESPKAVTPASPQLSTGAFAITKNNPSPEAAMRWVDYFYSEEGYAYLNQGPEGYLWKYAKDANGKKVKVINDGIDQDKMEDERGKITPDYGIVTPELNSTLPNIKKKADDSEFSPFQDFIRDETANKLEPAGKIAFPVAYLSKEEQDKVNATATDLTTYVEQMEAKFITGVESFDNWDKYVKTIEGMNVKEYVKTYQTVYDRWKKQ